MTKQHGVIRLLLAVVLGLGLGVFAFAIPASAACCVGDPFTNEIWNDPYYMSIGLGVIHLKDGSYTHGQYDAIIGPWDATWEELGWTTAAGFYLGPGYCAELGRDDGAGMYTQGVIGSGQHFIGPTTLYRVRPFLCSV